MRRILVTLIVGALALGATACGVAADDRAAVVAGRNVDVETVDDLARDETFGQLALGGGGETTESTLAGDAARGALLFEIQLAGLDAAADAFDVDVDEATRSQAADSLDQQLQGQKISATATSRATEYLALLGALGQRFAELDPASDADLQRVYDLLPDFWDRACVVILTASPEDADAVDAAIAGGADLDDIPEDVGDEAPSAQLADLGSECVPVEYLPTELAAAVSASPAGTTSGPLELAESQGTAVVWFRVDSFESLTFEDARTELASTIEAMASDQQGGGPLRFVTAWLIGNTEVNPRYGTGVGSSGGQLNVIPPERPAVPLPATAGAPGVDDSPAGSAP